MKLGTGELHDSPLGATDTTTRTKRPKSASSASSVSVVACRPTPTTLYTTSSVSVVGGKHLHLQTKAIP